MAQASIEKDLVKGLLYSIFDEKIGPVPFAWMPADLNKEMLEKITMTVMNLSYSMNTVPKELATIPVPGTEMNALVKYLMFEDKTRRGGVGKATLILLFDAVYDSIYYKYFKYIDDIFSRLAGNALQIQTSNPEKDRFLNFLGDLNKEIEKLFNDLKGQELSLEKTCAFPSEETCDPDHVLKYKVIVCGDNAVGKTSLVLQYTEKAFRATYLPTIGVNITEKLVTNDVNKKLVKFVIWDIAGQSKFTMMRRHFYDGSDGELLVFDITRRDSLQNIRDWYNDVKKNKKSPFHGILLGNKNDLEHLRVVSKQDAEALANELGLVYFETSAKTGENVDESFKKIAEMICGSV